jgi:hypothetical protein
MDMSAASLVRVVPTDRGHLVLEFANDGFRVFDALLAYRMLGWQEFAYSHRVKQLAYDAHVVTWPQGRRLDAAFLLAHSRPIDAAALARQTLRLGLKNRAPTAMHASHHEYGVHLFPFGPRPFSVGESIGGGHAEMGGSQSLDLVQLRAWPDWKTHFELAGCACAISVIESGASEREVLDGLIALACRGAALA